MKSLFFCFLALIITLASAYYQRRTGPTHPQCGKATFGERGFTYCLPRSHAGETDAAVTIPVEDTGIVGEVSYRRFKSADPWTTVTMTRQGKQLTATLPHQPPAGKLLYQITLTAPGSAPATLTREPVVMRFKGSVPWGFLVPHIVFMFTAMLLSTRAGLEALTRGRAVSTMTWWTLTLLFFGGLILGPIVQKYAFGSFWTGWPYGWDLTDNKTLIAFLVWLAAALLLRRPRARNIGVAAAAVILLAVYLIPHSVLGSEIDYTQLPATTTGTP